MLRIISLIVLVSPTWCNLVANFNTNGVTGTVTFTQTAVGQDVTITLDLANTLSGTYILALHEYRVNYDYGDSCATESIGNQIGQVSVTSGQGSLTVSGMDISGLSSIEGRSVLFTGGNVRSCATIEAPMSDYITAFAKMPANLGGMVIFRQKETNSDSDTMIYTNLEFVGTTKPTPLKWQIYDGTVKMDNMATTAVADRCVSTIGSLYNPSASDNTGCSTSNHGNCAVGSLSLKHGDMSVSPSGSTRNFFIDLSLPLSGDNSIIGKTLVFLDGNTVYACANIVEFPAMSAQADVSRMGVSGVVKVMQKSPLDIATITVNITNTGDTIGQYKIAQLPVPQKIYKMKSVCDELHLGITFNPFNVNSGSTAAASSTPDMYEVGDLSGKFGAFSATTPDSQTFSDTNLQLFGRNSVVGRSVVFYNKQDTSYFCSTLRSSLRLTTYVTRFTYPVIGYIILQQPYDMWYADTHIFVQLDYGTNVNPTTGHKWHVHEYATGNDTMTDNGRCSSAGGHYNPYNVDLAGNYASRCNPSNPLRCEVGDLSKKHSLLGIRKMDGTPQKTRYFFTDTQLPLHGPLSVIGKSITIHKENSGGPRLACTDIIADKPRELKVDSWSAAAGESVPSGSITFTQHCTDVFACVTYMHVQLTNLGQVSGYHVHTYPTTLDSGAANTCQNADVGGHYNPLGGPSKGPDYGTNDQYEVGDLSGKFGGLASGSVTFDKKDTNLPLLGPLSIAGRSIVIHRDSGSRWACGNIVDTSGTLVQAKATFTGDYVGHVLLSQYRYNDGTLSPTSFLIDLRNADGTVTSDHKWHVHESRHTNGDTSCSSSGGHYNPYRVDMSAAYGQECGKGNPLRCEAGDQSSKLGRYDIGSGKEFFTDVDMNVEGYISASKRSIVFHGANSASARIACANIMPYGGSAVTYEYSFPTTTYERTMLEKTVANAMEESYKDILAVEQNEGSQCTTVKLYFLGPKKTALRDQFIDLVNQDYQPLGRFRPGTCSTNSAGFAQISFAMMLASVLLAIFGRQH